MTMFGPQSTRVSAFVGWSIRLAGPQGSPAAPRSRTRSIASAYALGAGGGGTSVVAAGLGDATAKAGRIIATVEPRGISTPATTDTAPTAMRTKTRTDQVRRRGAYVMGEAMPHSLVRAWRTRHRMIGYRRTIRRHKPASNGASLGHARPCRSGGTPGGHSRTGSVQFTGWPRTHRSPPARRPGPRTQLKI